MIDEVTFLTTLPTARTIFASSKVPLRTWLRAICHIIPTKQGSELDRRLGIPQTTAWKMKHKLKQVMLARHAAKQLTKHSNSTAPTFATSVAAASADAARQARLRSSPQPRPRPTRNRAGSNCAGLAVSVTPRSRRSPASA